MLGVDFLCKVAKIDKFLAKKCDFNLTNIICCKETDKDIEKQHFKSNKYCLHIFKPSFPHANFTHAQSGLEEKRV